MRDTAGFILAKAEEYSPNQEFSDLWNNLHQLYVKRLWHQLTDVLLQLVNRPEMAEGDGLWDFYTNVIADFELKLNPLSLVEVCTPIVSHLNDGSPESVVEFLEKLSEKVKGNSEAFLMAKILIGRIYLLRADVPKTKAVLDEAEPLLDEIDGVGIVHSRFYMLQSDFTQQQSNYKEYYRAALHYLGCTELSTLSSVEQQSKAYLLSLAALLGRDVYNFGELLAHPILESLQNTERQWIVDLLSAFNSGDVQLFLKTKNQWSVEPLLVAHETLLMEKIRLLCVMDMTFRRAANHRQITFEEIAQSTGLNQNEIECLVMKCLSKGLVKGQIDQVSEIVDLYWVQPRVLNKNQLKTIQVKIRELTSSISVMEEMIETKANEILTI